MKTRPTLVSALFLASLTASPALASGDCVYSEDNKGSLDVFKFVKWEFGKRGRRWLKVNLTLHNNLKQTVKWFELTMLVDGRSISLNTTQTLTAESDALITAKYEMSDESAAKFQKLTP